MKTVNTLITILLLSGLGRFVQPTLAQAPTNNPISAFYNGAEGYPAWTDEIKWNNVYNMATYDYSGCSSCQENEFEKFKYVRDIAYNEGGGVLYYPAGTYSFDVPDSANSEGLLLKKGVVIRGQTPNADSRAVTTTNINAMSPSDHGLNSMPTKFVFSTITKAGGQIPKMWNCIGSKPGVNETNLGEVNHIGIAWVEIEFGYIWFGFGSRSGWAPTWGASTGFFAARANEEWKKRRPDGSHIMDSFSGNKDWGKDTASYGEKKFVFGCHLKNSAVPNYVVNSNNHPNWETDDGSYFFGGRLGVYGSHVFVANNVISKSNACFKMNQFCKAGGAFANQTVEIPFDYGKGIGIEINKSLATGFYNRAMVDDPNGFYCEDVLVRDNFVYNHSSKGYEISGKWVVIQNNINRREYYDGADVYNLGFPGPVPGYNTSNGRCRTSESVDDYMSRFMDLGGANLWIDQNKWGGAGSAFANDGEGILIQRHNGVEAYSWAYTYNETATATAIPGDPGYIAPYDVHCIGLFHGYNKLRGATGILGQQNNYGVDVSMVQNTRVPDQTPIVASGSQSANFRDFLDMACPQGNVPGVPSVQVKDTLDYVRISWSNVANEAGYRVERRSADSTNWTVIAYRPRQETGGLVTFGNTGPVIEGHIEVSANYGPNPISQFWDGKVRNMNPAEWRDYTKMTGVFEYRVVAVGCNNTNEGSSDSVVVVVGSKKKESLAMGSLRIHPVPAADKITVTLANLEAKWIRILDVNGKEIWKQNSVWQGGKDISIAGWSPGIYLIQVGNQNQLRQTRFQVK